MASNHSSKKENLFCFIHIEKTGGMTIQNMLHRDFSGYISPVAMKEHTISGSELKTKSKIYPLPLQGFGGHSFCLNESYEKDLERDIFKFCFLRNPVSRYLSQLNYRIQKMKQNWTIDSFLDYSNFNNIQCRRISGEGSFEAVKEIIDQINFIGSLEHFDWSVLYLSRKLSGFKPYYQKTNQQNYSKNKLTLHNFNPYQIQKLYSNNREDQKLFNYFEEIILPKQKKKLDFKDSYIENFRIKNKNYKMPKKFIIKRIISNRFFKHIMKFQ